MKVLDLFCGTKSIAKAFERHGHEVFTLSCANISFIYVNQGRVDDGIYG